MGKQKHREMNHSQLKGSASDNRHMPSRVAKRNSSGKKPKKNRNYLLPSLFFIFILIPVSILIYVAFVYEPDDLLQTSANENEVSVETNTNPSGPDLVVAGDEEDSEDTEDAKAAAEAEENAAKQAAAKKKAEQEQAAKEKAEKEQAAKEQAEKEQAAKEQAAKEQAEREAAERAQAEKEAREREEAKKEDPPASQRTHTVQASETLYRIAVNYYGSGDAVDRIKAANGLTSNEISVGQTLILP